MPLVRRPNAGFICLIGLIALAAGAKTILYDTLDPDCFWHLRVGEQLSREGVRPLRDSLSFASLRQPWTPYSWLAEIGMSKLWAIGGYRAAILLTALLVAGTMIFIAVACLESTPRPSPSSLLDPPSSPIPNRLRAALATAFAAFLSLPYLSFRPVTAAIFLLSICAWLIFRDRRLGERSRAVWLTIPVTALLVNVHLFAVLLPLWFGALLMGALWEGFGALDTIHKQERRRRTLRCSLLCGASLLACACTPMLPGMIASILHYSTRDPMVASKVIGEMQAFWRGGMGKIALGLVLAFAFCLVRRHRVLRAGELLLLLLSGALLLWLGRFAPIFALIAAPLFTVVMPELSDAPLDRPVIRGALAALLCLGLGRVLIAFPTKTTDVGDWLNRNGPDAPGYPVQAAAFLSSTVSPRSGRLINEFNWGGYLAWRLGDHYQVLLDGRTQVYAPRFWQDVYLGDGDTRRQVLTASQADAAILPVGNSRFRSTLLSMGWKPVHRDDRAEVLVPPEKSIADVNETDRHE